MESISSGPLRVHMDGVICELYGENAIFQEIENAKRSDSIQAE